LPELNPPIYRHDWKPDRRRTGSTSCRLVVTWAPDDSYRIDVSRIDPGAQFDSEVGVLLVTNVDDIDDLQAALRSQLGERAAVVRWRSPDDNDALRRTARELQANKGN
jgi:hypothetical protein